MISAVPSPEFMEGEIHGKALYQVRELGLFDTSTLRSLCTKSLETPSCDPFLIAMKISNPFSFTAICVAVIVYDYALTLSREIDLIWSSRWNVIKITFLLQRYLPFLDAILLSIIGLLRHTYESSLYLKVDTHSFPTTLHASFLSGPQRSGSQ
jgi:hypothetical protein